jgi:hypothetical protein
MKRTLKHYKTKPESGEENERLIENVFRELHVKSPEGVRYSLEQKDANRSVHLTAQQGVRADIRNASYRSDTTCRPR